MCCISIMNQSRIEEEVRELAQNQHVKQLEQVTETTFRLLYCPTHIASDCSNRGHEMEIVFPPGYPSSPPVIKFLSPFQHLNVCPLTGNVRISVVDDDWTPFLSINSIFESIDQIMGRPGEGDAVNPETPRDDESDSKDQYIVNISTSPERTLQQIQYLPCSDFSRKLMYLGEFKSPSEEQVWNINTQENAIDQIQESTSQEYLLDRFELTHSKSSAQAYTDQPHPSEQAKKNGLLHSQSKVIKQSRQLFHAQNKGIEQPRQLFHAQNKGIEQPSQPSLELLKRIHQMASLYVRKINEMEEQIEAMSNLQVKSILIHARDSHIEALKSLLQISCEAKTKIMRKIKEELSAM